jgi:hypothetical protein
MDQLFWFRCIDAKPLTFSWHDCHMEQIRIVLPAEVSQSWQNNILYYQIIILYFTKKQPVAHHIKYGHIDRQNVVEIKPGSSQLLIILTDKDWKHVEERFQKRLSDWKSKILSVGGRLVLINSVLSSLPMFMMSFFEILRGVLKRLDYFRSRFFWQSNKHKKKYRLTKRKVVCTPKDQGGLSVLNLGVHNKCLLSKWLFKLLNGDGVWQQLLKNKYLRDKTLTQVQYMPGDSHFWAGLMKVKDEFLSMGRFDLGDGS